VAAGQEEKKGEVRWGGVLGGGCVVLSKGDVCASSSFLSFLPLSRSRRRSGVALLRAREPGGESKPPHSWHLPLPSFLSATNKAWKRKTGKKGKGAGAPRHLSPLLGKRNSEKALWLAPIERKRTCKMSRWPRREVSFFLSF